MSMTSRSRNQSIVLGFWHVEDYKSLNGCITPLKDWLPGFIARKVMAATSFSGFLTSSEILNRLTQIRTRVDLSCFPKRTILNKLVSYFVIYSLHVVS